MAWIIAGMYEIQEQIGAGGGGIVYRGRHLRLDKQIVLKADKRTLNTDAQILRREVDMLKGLSQTYIPQVYDFVQENGVVYTVMDFIDGESLDHLLKRGQIPTQPQIIGWSCQLLEALEYLHSRPPYGILHGDIKPANIMLRPNGDICLIDYNIALALGEDGAVRVGFSWGYASPEHYGVDYSSKRKNQTVTTKTLGTVEPQKTGEVCEKPRQSQPDVQETIDILGMGQGENQGSSDGTVDIRSYHKTGQSLLGEAGQNRGPIPEEGQKNRGPVPEGGGQRNGGPSTGGGSTGSSSSAVMLDVRSDIYSLGATLYHLLSGQRPDRNALEVKALGPDVCSPAVWEIIKKAMCPDPDMRYQSAGEMLGAFRQLHRKDPRIIRHRRRMAVWTAAMSVLFLSGGFGAFTGMKQLERTKEALALSEYSGNSLEKGDISGAVNLALEAVPREKSIWEPSAVPQAQKALTDALGVYDLSDGFKSLDTIELPAAPFTIKISPKGDCFGVVYQSEAAVYEMETGERTVVLPARDSALSDLIFVDESRIVYAGEQGVTAYDLHKQEILWTGEQATTLAVSGDGTVVAAVDKDEDYAVLYRMSDGTKITDCSFEGHRMEAAVNDIFANPANRIFALDETGQFLAVSFSKGELWIFDIDSPEDNMIVYDETSYRHFEGGFCGKYFAFASNKSDESFFGLVDTEEGVYVGTLESRDHFYLKADEEGVCLANGNLLVRLDGHTLEETELAYTGDHKITGFSVGEEYILITTDDHGFSFYDRGANLMSSEICEEPWDFPALSRQYAVLAGRNGPTVRILKLENHEDARLLAYDARYAHDEARLSRDGRRAMLFNYENYRIYDMEGNVAAEGEFPDSKNIYDQQFRKNEEDSWLEVIWYDGTVRCYSAEDGSLILEEKREAPSKDLYEEFYTDRYRIASTLHGAPEVYDKKSGRKVGTLEEDAYLTYVTQAGEYVVTEYVSAEGGRYGLLLDEHLGTLAYLPNLCDIQGDMLVFDYGSGNLRQCRLYSLPELMALGETYIQK